ncbi:VAN3-binding protein-like protein [Tanacetum coccineum]
MGICRFAPDDGHRKKERMEDVIFRVRIYQKSQENSQKRATTDTRIRRVQKEAKESKPKPEKSNPQSNPAKRDKGIVAAGVVNVYVRVPQLERLTHLWLKADQDSCLIALRGAATFKARALKEAWNTTVVIPVDRGVKVNKNNGKSNGYREDLLPEENLLGMCNQELLCLR